ncbi:MAG: LCP family protein [Clostridium sp.]
MSRKEKKGKQSGSKNVKILKRILIGLVMAIILMIGAGIFYVYNTLGKIEKTDISQEDLGVVKEETGKDVVNIALFGVDAPKGQRGRSDSIMILSLDKEHNKIKLTSLMRDSYVNIPGYNMDKINHAYSYGGPALAVKTLNTNFGMNIEDFVTVNFTSLPKIIDAIGGVSIDITKGDLTEMPRVGITSSGMQRLNGEQALAYSRIRYNGGDQQRTQRHRNVMEAMLNEVKNISVSKIPGILTGLFPYMETSFTSTELISLATSNVGLLQSPLVQLRLPEDGTYKPLGGTSTYYAVYDLDKAKEKLRNFIYE